MDRVRASIVPSRRLDGRVRPTAVRHVVCFHSRNSGGGDGGLLGQARRHNLIDDVDVDAVSHALLGGLLTYALYNLAFAGEDAQTPALDRADAVVAVIMPALIRKY